VEGLINESTFEIYYPSKFLFRKVMGGMG